MSFHIFRSEDSARVWARFQVPGQGRLYLIECDEMVKIGMTQDPRGRLPALLGSIPLIACRFRSVMFSPVIEDYETAEQNLHSLLYRFRIQKSGGGFYYEHYEMPAVLTRAIRRYLSRVGSLEAWTDLIELIAANVPPASPPIQFVRTASSYRTTISISDDCHPDHSEAVAKRMKSRRSASFSNYVETLVAEDLKLKAKARPA